MLQFTKLMHKFLFTITACAMLALPVQVFADDESAEKPSFAPEIPHPTNGSTKCVRSEDEMKKNHMNYILHQRDETMHKGIRTETFALHECINCHVDKNSNVRFGDPRHFCSSCHNYAGVSIDCFQCHNDRPSEEDNDKQALSNTVSRQIIAGTSANNSAEGTMND